METWEIMLTLPPEPLPGEDSEGNILSLCAGKRSFLSKVVFTDAHNAGSSLPTHAPPSPKLSVQYQFTSRSMQSRQKAAPCRASIQIILSLSCQSKQWEEAGTFSSWEQNRPSSPPPPPPPQKTTKTHGELGS